MNMTLMSPTAMLVSVFFSRFILKRKIQLNLKKKKKVDLSALQLLPQFDVGEGTAEPLIVIILNLTNYEHQKLPEVEQLVFVGGIYRLKEKTIRKVAPSRFLG